MAVVTDTADCWAYLCIAIVTTCASGCAERSNDSSTTELSVFAASSLREGFLALEKTFEQNHPDVDIRFTFGGSQILRLQIEMGATADIFASANRNQIKALVRRRFIAESLPLALNELVLIVPDDNPSGIERFEQLSQARRIVLGAENVPAGIYAQEVLAKARVDLGEGFVSAVQANIVSKEANVRLVRAKVEIGAADAALVYRTDAEASKRVRIIPIPNTMNVSAQYFIGRSPRTGALPAADLFIRFVRSTVGQAQLSGLGFKALRSAR